MPVNVVTGPPFANKDKQVRAVMKPDDVLIDTTPLWRVLYPGHEPVRSADQAMFTRRVMGMAASAAATDPALTAWLVLAESRQQQIEYWRRTAQAKQIYLITDDPATLRKRAARHANGLGLGAGECEQLVDNWFAQSGWMEDSAMVKDFNLDFRAATNAEGHEIRTFVCDGLELREADGDSPRMVTGIAVKFGDEARLKDFTEMVPGRDAVMLPERAANVTIQHNRAMPVGLTEWKLEDDALRVSTVINEGARGDQTLADIRGGLLRGWSLEFSKIKDRWAEGRRRIIESMQVHRVSLVDDGAYAQSVVARCHGCEDTEALRDLLTNALASSENECTCKTAKRSAVVELAPAVIETAVIERAPYHRYQRVTF